jgi:hypothetical protein
VDVKSPLQRSSPDHFYFSISVSARGSRNRGPHEVARCISARRVEPSQEDKKPRLRQRLASAEHHSKVRAMQFHPYFSPLAVPPAIRLGF